jgi:hypothetical protein
MTKAWKIISSTPRMGGGGPPLKQYFLVATSNQSAALQALRDRRPDVEASQLTVAGETNTDNLEWQWFDCRKAKFSFLRRCHDVSRGRASRMKCARSIGGECLVSELFANSHGGSHRPISSRFSSYSARPISPVARRRFRTASAV